MQYLLNGVTPVSAHIIAIVSSTSISRSILNHIIFLAGQTCGTYYGSCRGLPTYAIIGIVSACIVTLSVCIRCCIHLNTVNNRRVPQAVPVYTQTPGQPVYQVHSFTNNFAAGRPVAVPVHTMREDAPPTYTAVVSETTPQGKY